jgi:hypothetical protein
MLRIRISLLLVEPESQRVLLGERLPWEERSSGKPGETPPLEILLQIGLEMLHDLPRGNRTGGWDER